jgi:hypothetical protein
MEKLYRKCLAFEKTQLKVPDERLVQRWGQNMGLTRAQVQEVSSQLTLRNVAGKIYIYV